MGKNPKAQMYGIVLIVGSLATLMLLLAAEIFPKFFWGVILGGLGSGLFFIASLVGLFFPKSRKLAVISGAISMIALVLFVALN